MLKLGNLAIVAVLLVAGAGRLLQAQNLGFISRQDYGINNGWGLAVSDFNGDGIADLATGENVPASAVCVYLGNGDGTFRPGPCTPTPGVVPENCAAADLNGDGNQDLVFSNSNTTDVYVLLGNGDGTFQPQIAVSLQGTPDFVSVGDFNGDGKPDLAVALALVGPNSTNLGVAVLLGNGDGTFGPPTIYPVGSAMAVAVADLNGDGIADLAAGTSVGVSVLLGNGDGTFTALPDIPVAKGVTSVTSGDYNGDGKTDLAVDLLEDVPYIAVLLGNGDGTFAPPAFHSCYPGWSIVTGDVNGDGLADLVAASAGGVSILFGKGNGNFAPQVVYAVGSEPVTVALADLRGNGALDIATANLNGDSLSVLLNKGKGKFQDGIQIAIGTGATSVVEGDFDGDGVVDVAVVGTQGVQILLGTGKPTAPFVTGASYSLSFCYSVAAGDFNGDGILDLAVGTGGGITILLGAGNGTFQMGETFAGSANNDLGNLAVKDLNKDGKLDIVTAEGTVLLGNGDGTFRPYYTVFNPVVAYSVAVGDFNGDGIPDLAFGYSIPLPVGVAVLLGNGNGTFQAPVKYSLQALSSPPNALVAADLNGDGKLDLAGSSEVGVWLLFGNGNGTFQEPQAITEPFWIPSSIAVGDYNDDGKLDLAVANGSDYSVTIFTGNGAGVFTYAGELGTDPAPAMVVGKRNLVTANGGSVSALSNLNKIAPVGGQF